MKDRIKFTGGNYDVNDARQVAIAQELDIKPRAAKTGAGINPGRIKNISAGGRDHLVYVDYGEDGQPVWRLIQPDGEQPLAPDESRELQNAIQNELQVGRLNVDRARIGQAPVQINPAITKPKLSMPAPSLPTFNPQPVKAQPNPAPAGGSSVLVQRARKRR